MTEIDSNHRGPIVNLATWITLVSVIIFATSKIVTKWILARRLHGDDVFVLIATSSAVGYCVAISVQVQSGFGQPTNALSAPQLGEVKKSDYVAQMFYILTIYTTKLASLHFQTKLTRPNGLKSFNPRRMSVQAISLCTAKWVLVTLIVLGFQCSLPHPWDQPAARCIDQVRQSQSFIYSSADAKQFAFWITNGVVDVTTQLFIGTIPFYLLWNLQLPKANKRVASMSFMPSLLTIPLAILRLTFYRKVRSYPNNAANSVNLVLVTIVHTNYSVIATCLTFLKPMVDSLHIGLMKNDIRIPLEQDESTTGDKKVNPFSILSGRATNDSQNIRREPWHPMSGGVSTSTVAATKNREFELQGLEHHSSQERMIIKQTKTTDVSSYPRPPPKTSARFLSGALADQP